MQPANQPTSQPANTSVVIAGNGPSLKDIDYRRLPKEFDVFRCNNFHLEDKYYLGKNIDGYFMCHFEFAMSTSFVLEERKEYHFGDFYYSSIAGDYSSHVAYGRCIPFVMSTNEIYNKYNTKIASYVIRNGITYNKSPTTGIHMILVAISLGYKDIYVTGIDFHKPKDGEMYAYSMDEASIYFKCDWVATEEKMKSSASAHSEDTEKRLIGLVKDMPNVNIYALSDNTELSKMIDLAPIQNDDPYIPEDKPEGYLKDIVFMHYLQQKEPPKGKIQKLKQKFIDKGLFNEWEFLRNNMFVGFFYQLVKMSYVLLKIFVKFFKK